MAGLYAAALFVTLLKVQLQPNNFLGLRNVSGQSCIPHGAGSLLTEPLDLLMICRQYIHVNLVNQSSHGTLIMAGVHAAALFAILAVFIYASKLILCRYQDADLTLHFFDHFGVAPASVLRGKVVWITGASSGIGEQLAYEFIKHGSKVVLSARRVEKLQQVRENCLAQALERDKSFDSNNVLVVPLDVMQFESHNNITRHVIDRFGQIDILMNNAGISIPGYVKDISLLQDQLQFDTQFVGTVSLTKSVLPYMMKRKQGQIGLTSSTLAKYALPFTAAYSASSSAAKGYFDALRLELLSRNISISTFILGSIDTAAFPDPKTGQGKHLGEVFPQAVEMLPVMPVERCAHLMVTSLVNSIDEAWVSTHPYLAVTYMSQYTPRIYQWFSKTIMMEWFLNLLKVLGLPPP